MKITYHLLLLYFFLPILLHGQNSYNYEPSPDHPYGLPNPEAPKELLDFAPLIGECQCKSLARIDQNTWADTVDMTWRFKYIMNGMAVQDETLKADGKHSGSIRQFIPDSSSWYVHYYSSAGPTAKLPSWEGGKTDNGNIVLYKDQSAPNGTPGNYKITFSNMDGNGFHWLGEWVNKTETFSYPNWKIYCTKTSFENNDHEKKQILKNIAAFSNAYINGDYETLANSYTTDGKIFPDRQDIVEGRAPLQDWWTIKNGSKILDHKVTPTEIKFLGDYAYDFGYYQGQSQSKEGEKFDFKGKYVIVWKKVNGEWKIYLDIWNRLG